MNKTLKKKEFKKRNIIRINIVIPLDIRDIKMKKYKVVKDPKYGYLRVDPIPTQKEVEKYYLGEFYSSKYKNFNDSSLKVQKEEKEFFESRWNDICSICDKFFGKLKGCSLFDIGFGFAQALLFFRKKGLEVGGLEPSAEGVKYAKAQGLKVFQSGIEDFVFHGLRHHFCSIGGELGASGVQLRSQLGHSSSRMTDHYSHLEADATRFIGESIEQRLLIVSESQKIQKES